MSKPTHQIGSVNKRIDNNINSWCGGKDTIFYSKKTLNLKGKIFDLSTPIVIGILNVTPDSFYDGGLYENLTAIIERAGTIIEQGGSIIDVGGYSSRPGATDISEDEEIKRITSAIKAILKVYPEALISIDTFRARVAAVAVEMGAAMINDISGGSLDNKMFDTVGKLNVPYILMHNRGTPQTMQSLTQYDDILLDLISYFEKKIYQLKNLGVNDIIIDPGFGFAKNIEQNFELLKKLSNFKIFNLPVLAGLSRKSLIYKTLNTTPGGSLNGTTVLNTIALINGASILRVHDVKEAVEVIRLINLINNYQVQNS